MKSNKYQITALILLFLTSSCVQNQGEKIGILDNGALNRNQALLFLKKVSKLQFHKNESQKLVQDYPVLTDDFLFKNIDQSYNKSEPLIKKGLISEFSFANYVLPYKVNSSRPQEWKDRSLEIYKVSGKQYAKFSDPSEILNICSDIGKHVNSLIKYKLDTVNESLLSLDDILKRGHGSCLSICDLTSYICRANGFPVSYDYVPAWGNMDGGHAWNVLVPKKDEYYPFSTSSSETFKPLLFINSDQKDVFSYRIPPKIYRRGFIPDTSSVYLKHYKELSNIGTTFTDLDVTSQYVRTIDFDIRSAFKKSGKLLILSVLNNSKWASVSAISPGNNDFVFHDIGVENLYFISSPDKKKDLFLFYVDKSGKVSDFTSTRKSKISIQRDRSVLQQQMEYINNHGWDLPEAIKNLPLTEKANLTDSLEYQLYGLSEGQWKLLETKTPINQKIITSQTYVDGLYLLTQKNTGITQKTRPFVFLRGKVLFI